MNKVAVLAALVTCSIICVQGNIFKNIMIDNVYAYLKDQYKDNPVKLECMIQDFQSKQIFDQFYPEDIILNPQKLRRELRPFFEEADSKCALVAFYESSLGLCVTVLAVASAVFVAFFVLIPARRRARTKCLNLNQRARDRKDKSMFIKSAS